MNVHPTADLLRCTLMAMLCSTSCMPSGKINSGAKAYTTVPWQTETQLCHMNVLPVQVLPLQVASLLLFTLPWTLPRLLDLQAANPVAVLEGKQCPVLINHLSSDATAALAH